MAKLGKLEILRRLQPSKHFWDLNINSLTKSLMKSKLSSMGLLSNHTLFLHFYWSNLIKSMSNTSKNPPKNFNPPPNHRLPSISSIRSTTQKIKTKLSAKPFASGEKSTLTIHQLTPSLALKSTTKKVSKQKKKGGHIRKNKMTGLIALSTNQSLSIPRGSRKKRPSDVWAIRPGPEPIPIGALNVCM